MIVLYIFLYICVLLYFLATKNYSYWSKRNVPHPKPIPFFGNYRDYILFRKCGPKITQEICQQFHKEPYVGVYYGTSPALIIKDPNIIKLVLSKDFYYFNHREVADHTHKEYLTHNMFFSGGDRWKVIRQNLTPLFSSAKIKNMFYLIENCATNLEKVLCNELKKGEVIETKSVLARYTMDCIGSCAFGVNTGTLEGDSKNNPFSIMGQKLFDSTYYGGFKLVTRSMWPTAFYNLGFRLFEDTINVFFTDLLSNVFKERGYKESSRNDFVDLILSWKKKEYLSGDSIACLKSDNEYNVKKSVKLKVDDTLLIGQCAMLFAAGFETTSTTISHLLFELAKHKDIQTRVINEIDNYYKTFGVKLDFECINNTPYVQACLEETLRLYPVMGTVTREVVEDYVLPTGLILKKGTRIHLPILYMHHNEEYFSEAGSFKPERFLGDEKKKIKPYTYMPFGEGHRICLGLRFSKMPMTAAILTIFKNYRVELAENMPKKLTFEPRTFVTLPIDGIRLKFIPR